MYPKQCAHCIYCILLCSLGILGDYNPFIKPPTLGSEYIPAYPLMVEELHLSGGFHLQVSLGEIPASNLAHGSRPKTRVSSAPNFGSFLEGKWDPGYFRKRSRLVKYYSIWPDVSMIGLLL